MLEVIWQQYGSNSNGISTNLDWLGRSSKTAAMVAASKHQHRQSWLVIELVAAGEKGQQQQRRQHRTDSGGGSANLDWQKQQPQDGSGGNDKTATTVTDAVAAKNYL